MTQCYLIVCLGTTSKTIWYGSPSVNTDLVQPSPFTHKYKRLRLSDRPLSHLSLAAKENQESRSPGSYVLFDHSLEKNLITHLKKKNAEQQSVQGEKYTFTLIFGYKFSKHVIDRRD